MISTAHKATMTEKIFGKRLVRSWRFWFLILLLAYTLFGFFGAPYIIKTQLIAKSPELLDRTLTLGQVQLNPFELSFTMKDVSLADPDGSELVGLDEFYVNFEAVESLVRWAWTVGEIRLGGPRFKLRLDETGQPSFADLLTDSASSQQTSNDTSGTTSELIRLALNSFKVTNGEFSFEDRSIATPYQQTVSPISFELKAFSTLPEREGPYAFQASLPDGALIRWQGEVSVNPIHSTGRIEIDHFRLTTAWRYAQDRLRFAIDQGLLATSTDYDFAMSQTGPALILNDIKLALTDIIIRDKTRSEPEISLPDIKLTGGQLNLREQKVQLTQLAVTGGNIKTFMNEEGEIDLAQLFTPIETPSNETSTPSETNTPAKETPPVENPWLVELNKAVVQNLSFAFTDHSTTPHANFQFDNIAIALSNISNQPNDHFDLKGGLKINGQGGLVLQGKVSAMPVTADLSIALTTLPLKGIQPYLNTTTNLGLASGLAGYQGKLSYMIPNAPAQLQLTGVATLTDFAADNRRAGGRFIAWQTLTLDGLSLHLQPNNLDIKTIVLDKLLTQLIVAQDQSINVSSLVKESTTATTDISPETKSEPFPISIGEVVLKNNAIAFTDNSITPHFTAKLSKLEGTVKGLSSANLARADVDLKGKVDNYAQLKIAGQINPLSDDLYTNLKIDFSDYDMTSFTPYTGKFIGQAVDKGRMSLNLVYSISQQDLKGENKVLLDQFTLGKKIESEDAIKAPVGLAIALLKDAKDRIDFDLPIRGNLNDPEFRFFHLIPKALLNLITGIATSPFKLLGKLAGGAKGDLDHVNFTPGNTDIAATQVERLNTLAKALTQRPQLRLDVRGQYDSTHDKATLQQQKLRAALKMAPETGFDALSLTQLEDHYNQHIDPKGLATIKDQNSHLPEGAKEGDTKALDETAYKQALIKASTDAQSVSKGDLRDLALARANNVRNYLVENKGLAVERIFILEAGTVSSKTNESVPTQFDLSAH